MNTVLPAYCARPDIGFGHPTGSNIECGECAEIRVKKDDGTEQVFLGMRTDNGGPEITTAIKQKMTEGVTCPNGEPCQMLDRIKFDWRKVDCMR